jgi:hypothetical protein
MSDWRIQKDGKTLTWPEEKLRRKLRRGDLTGVEVARPEGAGEWRPLHAWPVFREEVAVEGADTERAPLDRQVRGFLGHLVAFVGVMIGFTVMTGSIPFWGAFWAIGLVLHAVRVGSAIVRRAQRGHASQAAQAVEAVDAAALPEDAQHAALLSAVAALAGAGGDLDVDMDALRRAGADLAEKRGALESALPADGARALEQQLAAAQARATVGGPDAADHEAEARALRQRLSHVREVTGTVERLRARERALLHEVEALRLAALQAAAHDAEAPAPDLAAAAARLRAEVAAADEVDDLVRRARLAAQARTTR